MFLIEDSSKLHLFDQKYSKIVKYYYNVKQLFSICDLICHKGHLYLKAE